MCLITRWSHEFIILEFEKYVDWLDLNWIVENYFSNDKLLLTIQFFKFLV